MNENVNRYVLIDGEYRIYFTGYYHSLPSISSSQEYIEITADYSSELFELIQTLPTTVHQIELYAYNEETGEMVLQNSVKKTFVKQQVATNYRDFGTFKVTITYQVAK